MKNLLGKRVVCIKKCLQISTGSNGIVERDHENQFMVWFDEPTFLGDVASQMWILSSRYKKYFEVVEETEK